MATFSDAGPRPRKAATRAVLAVCLAVFLVPAAWGKVFITQDEALKTAFPGETGVKRETAYLTEEQAAAVEKLCGEKPASRVVTYYSGRAGTAYFDTHLVRTLPETVMVLVTPGGTIGRIDILSFNEPEDYLPRARWLEQFSGKPLDEELSLKKGIRPMTGATLSARSILACSRRVLALHQVIHAAPVAPGGKP